MVRIETDFAPSDIPGYLSSTPKQYKVYICDNCGDEFNRDNAHSDDYCDDCMKELWEGDLTEKEMWEYLEEGDYCSHETLDVITDIWGFSKEVLYKVLYAVSGYNCFSDITDDWELY